MATSEARAIWSQKRRVFQGPPRPLVLEMDGVHCTEKTLQIRFKVLYQERITLKVSLMREVQTDILQVRPKREHIKS